MAGGFGGRKKKVLGGEEGQGQEEGEREAERKEGKSRLVGMVAFSSPSPARGI